MKSVRRWFLVTAVITVSSCALLNPGNQSVVVVLLDYSKTFAPYVGTDAPAIKTLSRSISELIRNGQLEQPTKIVWAAFGDNGLQPVLPCGPPRVFKQSLKQSEANDEPGEQIETIEALEAWLAVCVTSVMKLSAAAQTYTDVSGALAFAGNAVEGTARQKLVLLFSDLREDLPSGRSPQSFDLERASLAVIWRPGLDDQQQPELVPLRLLEWEARFAKSNVGPVCSKPAQSMTAGDLAGCLSK